MAPEISVVIPNYNGQNLLAQNLPQVLKHCPGAEIIVVDDASNDDSVSFVGQNFPDVKLIVNNQNLGFARSVNRGVQKASGDLVLLLNSDVSPRPNFLLAALKHFRDQKDNRLFAVGLADLSHEGGQVVIRGRGGAIFHRGLLTHFAAKIKAGPTLWVSGGSSLVDKKKFIALGGFDEAYAPFYWEDIDLCWQAAKSSLVCLFEPNSRVDHFHEKGAIKKHHSSLFIKTVAYKNQLIFVWNNISDPSLLAKHLLWLPYHLLRAAIKLDLSFFAAFIWATYQIPYLIFNNHRFTIQEKLSDREVLKKFEKP